MVVFLGGGGLLGRVSPWVGARVHFRRVTTATAILTAALTAGFALPHRLGCSLSPSLSPPSSLLALCVCVRMCVDGLHACLRICLHACLRAASTHAFACVGGAGAPSLSQSGRGGLGRCGLVRRDLCHTTLEDAGCVRAVLGGGAARRGAGDARFCARSEISTRGSATAGAAHLRLGRLGRIRTSGTITSKSA